MLFAMMLSAVLAGTSPPVDPRLGRMAALFDEVCLKTFPDDAAMDRTMASRGARQLTDAQAKVTLVDDPGRGWEIDDQGRSVAVFLELPPYHACSVRFPLRSDSTDDSPYRAVVEPYKQMHPGFVPGASLDRDNGPIHIHAIQEARRLPDGGAETLMLFDQTITDPARRAGGETGIMRRFVHQLVAPAAAH